jgi:hypothetical protein
VATKVGLPDFAPVESLLRIGAASISVSQSIVGTRQLLYRIDWHQRISARDVRNPVARSI